MITYPDEAHILIRLLAEDQAEWGSTGGTDQQQTVRRRALQRADTMLQILGNISEPTLSALGSEAAQAMSILATHASLSATHTVLDAFTKCYVIDPENTYYQAIPALTDWVLILERMPQRFGTIWLYDQYKYPYLPTVESFEHLYARRRQYGIGPLHWPKSLTISLSGQPWLKKPLSELVMRTPTDQDYQELAADYLI